MARPSGRQSAKPARPQRQRLTRRDWIIRFVVFLILSGFFAGILLSFVRA